MVPGDLIHCHERSFVVVPGSLCLVGARLTNGSGLFECRSALLLLFLLRLLEFHELSSFAPELLKVRLILLNSADILCELCFATCGSASLSSRDIDWSGPAFDSASTAPSCSRGVPSDGRRGRCGIEATPTEGSTCVMEGVLVVTVITIEISSPLLFPYLLDDFQEVVNELFDDVDL